MSRATTNVRSIRVATLALTITGTLGLASAQITVGATSGGWSNLGDAGTPGTRPLNAPAFAMTRHGTDLFIGGSFTDAGGLGTADRVARWDGSAWHAVGGGLTGEIRSIAVDGTKVYVAGAFQNASGNSDVDHLATWNGSAWVNVGGAHMGGDVNDLVIIGRRLCIGGA